MQGRAVATVDAIVEAAAHILDQDGIAAYSTNAIAERAGVSIGSLYQYFPNKGSITNALAARESRRLIDAVAAIPQTGDWRNIIAAVIRAVIAHQLSRPNLARLIDIAEDSSGQGAFNPHSLELMALLRPLIAPAVENDASNLDEIVGDLFIITRALTDAAGAHRQLDWAALESKVRRAVFGYLAFTEGSQQ